MPLLKMENEDIEVCDSYFEGNYKVRSVGNSAGDDGASPIFDEISSFPCSDRRHHRRRHRETFGGRIRPSRCHRKRSARS